MIKSIHIENYKSIANIQLELGRFNVFIGENGSGKTNLLEAVSMASACAANQLSQAYLTYGYGVRVGHVIDTKPTRWTVDMGEGSLISLEASQPLVRAWKADNIATLGLKSFFVYKFTEESLRAVPQYPGKEGELEIQGQ
jgi:energy-coupling factor transporter ATP-binding protein EcfA2